MNIQNILKQKYIIESINKKFKTPKELLYYMKNNFTYGWIYQGKKQIMEDSDFVNKYYRLLQPNQVEKYKVGTCFEQALYAYSKLITMGFKCKLIAIHQYYTQSHLFVIFKIDDKWWHLENSFEKYQGLHGPYINIKNIIDDVHKQMIQKKDYGYNYKIIKPEKLLKKNIDLTEILLTIGFNFNKT